MNVDFDGFTVLNDIDAFTTFVQSLNSQSNQWLPDEKKSLNSGMSWKGFCILDDLFNVLSRVSKCDVFLPFACSTSQKRDEGYGSSRLL